MSHMRAQACGSTGWHSGVAPPLPPLVWHSCGDAIGQPRLTGRCDAFLVNMHECRVNTQLDKGAFLEQARHGLRRALHAVAGHTMTEPAARAEGGAALAGAPRQGVRCLRRAACMHRLDERILCGTQRWSEGHACGTWACRPRSVLCRA